MDLLHVQGIDTSPSTGNSIPSPTIFLPTSNCICQRVIDVSTFVKEHQNTPINSLPKECPHGSLITYMFPKGLHHNGFNYTKKDKFGKRYGCVKWTDHCHGRLQLSSDNAQQYQVTEQHTCRQDKHKTLSDRVITEILKFTGSSAPFVCSTKSIFRKVEAISENVSPNVTFQMKRKTIQRAKNQKNPGALRSYQSIQQYYDHLSQHPHLLKYTAFGKESTIEVTLVTSDNNTRRHLMFYGVELMTEIIGRNGHTNMFCDATYSVTPKIKESSQMLTIMLKKYNLVVPCIWIIMSSKTKSAYSEIFKKVKDLFPELHPHHAMTDFETAMMYAIKQNYRDCHIRGCYFHWCQAVVRMARKPRFQLFVINNNANSDPIGHEILRKVLILPLLPEDKIVDGFNYIKSQIIHKYPQISEKKNKWLKFMDDYILDYWIQKKGTKWWCVYKVVHRTNNFCESYHSPINNEIRGNPDPFVFVQNIIRIKDESLRDLEKAKLKLPVRGAQRLKAKLNDQTIGNAWDELSAANPWTIDQFIEELSGYSHDATLESIRENLINVDERHEVRCDTIVNENQAEADAQNESCNILLVDDDGEQEEQIWESFINLHDTSEVVTEMENSMPDENEIRREVTEMEPMPEENEIRREVTEMEPIPDENEIRRKVTNIKIEVKSPTASKRRKGRGKAKKKDMTNLQLSSSKKAKQDITAASDLGRGKRKKISNKLYCNDFYQ